MDVFALSDLEFLGLEQEIPRASALRALEAWRLGLVRLSLAGIERTVQLATGSKDAAEDAVNAYIESEMAAGRKPE